MRRGEVRYADVGGSLGRRPVVIVTASELIDSLREVVCVPVTTTLREIPTHVALGKREGLRTRSEAACESLTSIAKQDIDTVPLGSISPGRFGELDRAIARALGIRRENLPLR